MNLSMFLSARHQEATRYRAVSDLRRTAGSVALAGLTTFFLLCCALSLSAQAPSTTPVQKSKAGATAISPASAIQFENVIQASKIKFALKNSVSPKRYTFETMVGGVALFDYNNDGLLDIFFTNGAAIPSLEKSDPSYWNRLFRNNGDGTFTDVTEKAGLRGIGYSMGVAAGDYDNDGFVDLYVTGVNHNQLLHNNGDGTFTDVTTKAGVGGFVPKLGKAWSVAAGWFDYNNDGLLDLFVVNYLNYSDRHRDAVRSAGASRLLSRQWIFLEHRTSFTATTATVPLRTFPSNPTFPNMSAKAWAWRSPTMTTMDSPTSSSRMTPSKIIFSTTKETEPSPMSRSQAGVAYNAFGNAIAGMGADFRDIDNDGKPDIFETAMFGEGFPLYKNLGDGQFQDVTAMAGLAALTSRSTAWGAGVFDFDNDGNKDLFTANSDILDNSMELAHRPFALPNRIFRNKGNLIFEDVSSKAGKSFAVPAAHRGAAFGDLNNDGKIDAVVTVLNGPPEIWMNRSIQPEPLDHSETRRCQVQP